MVTYPQTSALTLFTIVYNIEDMIEKLKKAIKKIKDDDLYSPEKIHGLGVIVNTKLKPSMFTVYRLIKSGKLSAVDFGAGKHSRHFVKGVDLKKYLVKTYKL